MPSQKMKQALANVVSASKQYFEQQQRLTQQNQQAAQNQQNIRPQAAQTRRRVRRVKRGR